MASRISLEFSCNGTMVRVEVPSWAPLASVLRDQLGLTGSKIGCEEGECGACTVLVDGLAVNSCIYPAAKVTGRQVLTVEGLQVGGQLHPLQQAFIEHGAVQCGYCTPGLLMSAYALLLKNPDPSETQIRRALSGNLCRCTGYLQVIRAVQHAARVLRH